MIQSATASFTNPSPSTPPPDPPDLTIHQMDEDPPRKPSYKDVVTEKSQEDSACYNEDLTSDDVCRTTSDTKLSTSLSKEEKLRIYFSWKCSVIIKCVGKKFNHNYLRSKLAEIWKLEEKVILIDLGEGFFTVKLVLEESQKKILHEGPWFVAGSYVSTRK